VQQRERLPHQRPVAAIDGSRVQRDHRHERCSGEQPEDPGPHSGGDRRPARHDRGSSRGRGGAAHRQGRCVGAVARHGVTTPSRRAGP
jgi:hypothetical protein